MREVVREATEVPTAAIIRAGVGADAGDTDDLAEHARQPPGPIFNSFSRCALNASSLRGPLPLMLVIPADAMPRPAA